MTKLKCATYSAAIKPHS